MTRRSLLNRLSNEEQSLKDVWDWYQFQRAMIDEGRSRVFAALSAGENLTLSRYVGKMQEELGKDFVYQIAELRRVSILGILACTEAVLRVDFIERIGNKRKDAVSRCFQGVYRRRGIKNIRLEEDVLDTWKEQSPQAATKVAVAEFKGALKLRHWLAHCRYWKPKLGRVSGYGLVDIFEICQKLLQALELMPLDSVAK